MTLRKVARLLVVLSLLFASVVATAATGTAVQGSDEPELRLKAGDVTPDRSEEARPSLNNRGQGYYVVQFDGPILQSQSDALRALDAELMSYLPDFAYKVRMRPAAAGHAAGLDGVVFVGAFEPDYKLSPDLEAEGLYTVSLERGVDRSAAAAAIQEAGVEIVSGNGRIVTVFGDGAALAAVAEVADVAWIENLHLREKHNEFGAGVIIGANTANAAGYDGSTQIVAVADTGIGDGTTTGAHVDIPASRVVSVQDWPGSSVANCYNVFPDGAQDVDSGHGTHVSVSVLGDGSGTGLGQGTAPAAQLVFQATEDYADMIGICAITNPDGYYLLGLPDDLEDLLQAAYDDGARLHSDSWGSDVDGDYTADSASVDNFIWSNPDFLMLTSAGNDGADLNANGVIDDDTTGSPATAKNLLTVGASENDRQGNWDCDTGIGNSCTGQNDLFTYGSAWPADFPVAPIANDPSAGNAEQMAAFSSRGPTDDGRIKPDVVAPGTWILSGYSDLYQEGYDGVTNPQNGAFQYDGWGFPVSEDYKYMGGTSMSTPITSGAAAVVRDYYVKAHGHNASAALTKASLINSADDLLDENNDGANDNDFPIPNSHEGWGRVDLADSVDGSAQWVDEATGVGTSGAMNYDYTTDGSTDLRISLVWSDFPSTASASVNLVNDLDLIVTGPGGTYFGNNFSGGWSTTGGSADRINNVENVYIPNAAAGTWSVTVSGFNVPMGPQPFALVVDGTGDGGPQNPNAAFSSSCIELDCDFTDESTDSDGTVVSWDWDFGDGNTSTAQNPSHSYAAGGSYTVSLTVTDNDGLTDSTSLEVTVTDPGVNSPPTAAFSSSCTDLECDFTDTSSDSDGSVVSWDWDFGDGNTSTAQNPSHSYAAAGTYTVTLTVTDDDGATDSTSTDVTVTEPPAAIHVGDLDPGSSDNGRRWNAIVTVTVHDAAEVPVSGATVDGSWSDGTNGSGSCVTDGSGTCAITRNNVRDSSASATFTVDDVTLTGVSYDAGANHDPDGDSDGTVVVVDQDAGSNAAPNAGFTSSCTDLECDFTDTSSDSDGSVVLWDWDFGDGNTSTAQNPSHAYAASGTYTVSLTVTDDGGASDTETASVTVVAPGGNLPPTAGFVSSCTDLDCDFTDTSGDSDGSVVSWDWDFGDGNTSTAQDPSHSYAVAGTYTVTLTVTDDDGATDSTSTDVTVTDGTGGTTMHIADLDAAAISQGASWLAIVTITVVDENGAPVNGATVSGTFRRGEVGECTTDVDGTCDVELLTSGRRQEYTVNSVSHGALSYDPGANTDPDGDSDGTVIVIDAP